MSKFMPLTQGEIEEMLREISIETIEELFDDIPPELKISMVEAPRGRTEYEVKRHVMKILSKNKPYSTMPLFLGGGVWPHYVPSVVKYLSALPEFVTGYTPYQPEISQGILQALFEYQSMICELTGMDVANASMYDWASSLGEAALMALRVTGKKEIVIPQAISPEREAVLKTYIHGKATIRKVAYDVETGMIDLEGLQNVISKETAGVYIENPNYFGVIECEAEEAGKIAHEVDAIFIVGVDPISLGVLTPPGDYGADIVIGEGQPLGVGLNFGGPLLGIFTCRNDKKMIRNMPGRIIGITEDYEGNRCYTITLQTREQHIRREKATSNICSNETLCAVQAAIYMAYMGPKGIEQVAKVCMANARYLMKKIDAINGFKAPIFSAPHFKEFTVRTDFPSTEVHKTLINSGVHGGKMLKDEFPELGEAFLFCVTEVHTEEDVEALIKALSSISS
ncbi:MAG: aminomethyl-transferring glycine dehydrogenase subunit GcvPA [Candidatus Freyarchaeota archaeon]|nr:aminomethyl-transferring glycine dehydrogenase subunit GcvPA [Candidatus Freyrarchaeum guaymaensis]HDO80059.1 aminomethyl-transferring glycine dehydrogenase subunit GcvPA [Candidatus Bathyarchaeota archaeon]